jgi:glutamyl-tRNA synthetase
MKVRTRFAPSPTGKQHMGNIRTAVYSWLLARHYGGTFILRIEDTDQARRVPGAVRSLFEELEWFGLTIDEGPSKADLAAIGEDWNEAPELGGDFGSYIQSQRLVRYQEAANELLAKGVAYRADFAEGQEGNLTAPHTIRLRIIADHAITIPDAVHGPLHFDSVSLNDPVLLKSDGFPTYHLACVVDDHHMEITHVVRGDDWIATYPIHYLLYEAFGWDMPIFAHVPNVLGSDGKKLSKRHGATTAEVFREQGYLAQALLNFTALVGWSSGDDREIFNLDELTKAFSLTGIQRAGGIFDYTKLEWMNGMHIRALSVDVFKDMSAPFLLASNLVNEVSEGAFNVVANAVQERVKTLAEVASWVSFLYTSVPFEPEWSVAFKKGLTLEQGKTVADSVLSEWVKLEFSPENIENSLKEVAEVLNLKPGAVFGLVRVATLGAFHTPPLGISIMALGRTTASNRLKEVKLKV